MDAIYFNSPADFRKWLDQNHAVKDELLVGFYKVKSGKCSMTWPEAVDQALCFGWIDGVKRSVDSERYTHRFTPRRKGSIWSNVNIEKVKKLMELKLMHEAGIKAFEARTEARSGIYAHEMETMVLTPELEKQFRAHKTAWDFFDNQAPSYKKVIIKHIMSARQPATQQTRLLKTIAASARQERL